MIKSALQSSLTNDVKYASMSAGNLPSSEYLIQTTVVGATPVASVEFDVSDYAGVYRHLKIVSAIRTTRASSSADFLKITFNSDTTGYARHALYSNGSTPASYGLTDIIGTSDFPASTSPANQYGAFVMDILDPFNTNKNTTIRLLGGSAGSPSQIMLTSGLWVDTTPVSSIKFEPGNVSSNIDQYSRFSVYGVTA